VPAIFLTVAVFTLVGLLYAEKQGSIYLKSVYKPVASAMFLLTALSGGPSDTYDWALFVGLALCWFGDVLLIPKDRPKWFLFGLISFLLGHVAYIVAFNRMTSVASLNLVVLALILLFSIGVFLWLRPHVGKMQGPVVAYIVAITLMLCSAWAVFFATDMPDTFRCLVSAGATAFYLSDITVARDRFMGAGFLNRAVGLPLYYLGQFLLALSIGVN
jgi:uncharacterized membrane protein YhhN